MKPVIGLTIGSPSGVGPEIVLKALHRLSSKYRFVVFGDTTFLAWVNKKALKKNRLPRADYRDITNISLTGFHFGRISKMGGKAAFESIVAGVEAAQKNEINALVTAPINKEELRLLGLPKQQPGHTEILAHLTHAKTVALMLLHKNLRAVHVTSHIPLRKVSSALNTRRIFETIMLAHDGLKKMRIRNSRIAVCGLNPHAGENGLLGLEERKVIAPAVRKASKKGIRVTGPLSADTVWPMVRDGKYDVGIAMYHDQGQIPIKYSSFQAKGAHAIVEGVNVTLGLPIVRTSPAHGTAYEIAGKGLASEASFVDAIQCAASMVR